MLGRVPGPEPKPGGHQQLQPRSLHTWGLQPNAAKPSPPPGPALFFTKGEGRRSQTMPCTWLCLRYSFGVLHHHSLRHFFSMWVLEPLFTITVPLFFPAMMPPDLSHLVYRVPINLKEYWSTEATQFLSHTSWDNYYPSLQLLPMIQCTLECSR